MGLFVTISDFTGKFAVSTGMYANTNIQSYIDRYEDIYLTELFGISLYDLFIADLDVNDLPQATKYEKIFEAFKEEIGFQLIISKGMKDMLVGFIYFEYMKDSITQTTPIGVVKQQSENSNPISAHTPIYLRYNESVKTYRAIQDYIMQNMSTYPEFRGYVKQYAYWL
jgi:hypothetical protein